MVSLKVVPAIDALEGLRKSSEERGLVFSLAKFSDFSFGCATPEGRSCKFTLSFIETQNLQDITSYETQGFEGKFCAMKAINLVSLLSHSELSFEGERMEFVICDTALLPFLSVK